MTNAGYTAIGQYRDVKSLNYHRFLDGDGLFVYNNLTGKEMVLASVP